MKFIVSKDYQHCSAMVSHLIEGTLKQKKDAWIALPSGQTFDGMYEQLVQAYTQHEVDFSMAHFVLVHEYVGIGHDHPASVYQNLKQRFFDPCKISLDHVHAYDGLADPSFESRAFNQFMDAVGAMDLIVTGIGLNGHMAYNQPTDELYPRIHTEYLDESSRQRLSYQFDDINEVPNLTLTLGIQDLLNSKKLVILASGSEKSTMVKLLVDSKTLNTKFPVSFVHLHRNAVVCADQGAALETGIRVEV